MASEFVVSAAMILVGVMLIWLLFHVRKRK